MKKIFAILLAAVTVISLFAGCDDGHDYATTTAPTEVITDPTDKIVTAPTIDETEAPVETTAPTETEEPTEAPTEAETVAPTEASKPVHQHGYSAKVTKAATCTEDGIKTYTCSCGASYTESVAAEHAYECTDTRPATCSNTGDKTYTCKVCGYSYKETLPKNEHKWSDWVVTKEPTTTCYGQKVRECELCHGAQYANIDPLPADDGGNADCTSGMHTYVVNTHKEPTCEEYGSMSTICSVCGEPGMVNDIPPTGHNWGEWVSASGTDTHTCSACGKTETRSTITDCEANGYSHSISPADQVGYTRGADYYRVRCYCGHGARGATEEAALAAHNKHVETTDINCNHGLEWITVVHDHIAPSGTFICTKCRKEVAHSPIYAPHCDIIGCHG